MPGLVPEGFGETPAGGGVLPGAPEGGGAANEAVVNRARLTKARGSR